MVPLVAALLKMGMGMIGNAVIAKGKDVVQEKLGVNLEEALGTEEGRLKLKQAEMTHEEWLVDAGIREREQELEFQKAQEANVTERWKADMGSDSWLAKNVRPATLLYILTAYTVLALLSGWGVNVAQAYVELLGQWGMLVMTAYFGGRSLEKIAATRAGGDKS